MLARVQNRTAFVRENRQEDRNPTVRNLDRRNCHSRSPPLHANAQVQAPANTTASNTHANQANSNNPFLSLPSELLLMILNELDQPSLESLRRTSPAFLRVLPNLYPQLFSHALQGPHPWPVRRLWTLSSSQRQDLLVLVTNTDPPPTKSTMQPHHAKGLPDGRQVPCCGIMGLANAWRYIPCPDCGLKHPPRALPASLPVSLQA